MKQFKGNLPDSSLTSRCPVSWSAAHWNWKSVFDCKSLWLDCIFSVRSSREKLYKKSFVKMGATIENL